MEIRRTAIVRDLAEGESWVLADWGDFRDAEEWVGRGGEVRGALVVDAVCDMVMGERMGTFPCHDGCARGLRSYDLVDMLCRLLGGRFFAVESFSDTES